MLVEAPENVTDNDIEDELAPERGHSPTYLSSLIHDEAFQLEAQSFEREHAYKKGEPNLTISAFREWIGKLPADDWTFWGSHKFTIERGCTLMGMIGMMFSSTGKTFKPS